MALESNERPGKPVVKFESMLKTDDVYFFDAEDFQDIIHHYLSIGKIALAKKAIKISLRQHPDSIELELLDVEVHIFENNLDLAEKLLDKLQLIDSNNEEIYIQRANIQSKKDNHVAAIDLLNKALELSNNHFDIHSLLGMEYLFLDDFKLAKENFIKCILYDEHDYSSLYNIIHCFEFLEDFDGAIYYLNDYLDRNPYCEVAWHQLGKQYYTKEMYLEAVTAYDFAIIADDTFIGAYFERGKVLEKLGKYREAIENYETTIKTEDPTSYAYLRIGKCHEKSGNDDMAKFYFYQTVHQDPLLDKGWLAITDFYHKKKNYKKALFYINKALNIDSENSSYWKKCGKIHTSLKNYQEADYSYKQVVGLGNFELDTWLKWADAAHSNTDFASAVEILAQGRELHPEDAELAYKLAGLQLLTDDNINARISLIDALKIDSEKLYLFQEEFPQYNTTEWILDLISRIKKASS